MFEEEQGERALQSSTFYESAEELTRFPLKVLIIISLIRLFSFEGEMDEMVMEEGGIDPSAEVAFM